MAKQIARRMLVRLLGLAGVAAAVTPGAAYALPRLPTTGRLVALLADQASARQVGRAYLKAMPADSDRAQLLSQLAARLDHDPSRETYAACCRRDFAEGRTVTVNGWVLSQTEARLCALAALA
jgi:hypothetical protein